ncbi:MAG: YqzL family protein [Bacillota bacterium]|nr:YqzL family protein [Bacillota bacterium]
MLRDLLWNAFEKTGEIDKYIFYKEISEKDVVKNEIVTAAEEEVAISK